MFIFFFYFVRFFFFNDTATTEIYTLSLHDALPICWLLPLLVAFIIVNVRGWSEHLLTAPGNLLTETRTVVSNAVVRFFLLNLNYHLEHHLCPGIPWYNVPQLHAELREEYRRAGAFIQQSYLAFLRDAFRTGIHGHSPAYPESNPARHV